MELTRTTSTKGFNMIKKILWAIGGADYSLDVARTTVVAKEVKSCKEQFLIKLSSSKEGAELAMIWDFAKVVVPIKI